LRCPTEAATAHPMQAAEAALRTTLARHCTAASVPALAGCDGTVAGLQTCVVADHWDHVQHVLDQQYGDLTPVTDPGIQGCQATIAQAGRQLLGAQTRAMAA